MSAYTIAEEYFKQYSRALGRRTNIKNYREHKWWVAFEGLYKLHGYKKDFDEKMFISANFEKFGKVFPYQLLTKKAWEAYEQKKAVEGEPKDKEKEIAEKVVYFLKVLKLFQNKGKSVEDFVLENWNKIANHQYDLYVLVFSKSFMNKNKSENFLDDIHLQAKRHAVLSYDRIMYVIEKNLGEDYSG